MRDMVLLHTHLISGDKPMSTKLYDYGNELIKQMPLNLKRPWICGVPMSAFTHLACMLMLVRPLSCSMRVAIHESRIYCADSVTHCA